MCTPGRAARGLFGALLLLGSAWLPGCGGSDGGVLVEIWPEAGGEPAEYLLFSWERSGRAVISERRIPAEGTLDATDGALAVVAMEMKDRQATDTRRVEVQGLRDGRIVAAAVAADVPVPASGWLTIRLVLRQVSGGDAEPPGGDPKTPDAGTRPGPLPQEPDAGEPTDMEMPDASGVMTPLQDAGSPGPKPQPDAGLRDAGMPPPLDAAAPPPPPPAPPPPENEVIVVAARRGLRMMSRDRGLTWTDPASVEAPVDVEIDGITFGGGRFVAVGGRYIFVSPNGRDWKAMAHGFGWLQAVAHGNGRYVAVGGNYVSAWSLDAETWTLGEPVRYAGGDYNVNTVIFHDGFFYATGVNGGAIPGTSPVRWNYRMYRTADALRRTPPGDGSNPTWTFVSELVSGDAGLPSIEVCDGAVRPTIECGPTPFHGFGVWLRGGYPDQIQRSTDGKSFTTVHKLGTGVRAFAFGVVP